MISRRTAALGGVVLVVVTAILTWGLAAGAYGVWPGVPPLRRPGLRELARGIALIQARAYRPVDPAQLAQDALRGAVASLGDPYSAYLSPAAFRALQSSVSGHYTGVGIEVEQDAQGYPLVVGVFAGSPAAGTPYAGAPPGAAVGLRAGDRLVAVNGQPTRGMAQEAIRNRIVGAPGTRVTLEVVRPADGGAAAPHLLFTLTRRAIQVRTVTSAVLPGGVGYLHVQMFNRQTPAQMATAVAALQAQHVRAVVVDLRGNPGGLLDAAQQVARYLLPGGVVAYLQPRGGPRRPLQLPAPRPLGVPYAVLVDGHTASAAELLAAAIQDDHAAPLVGERTFGKGSVQRVFPLAGGAALKLTVAHYLTPSGRDINGVGVTPGEVVPFPGQTPAATGRPATDPQLRAAIRLLDARAA